MNTQVSGSFSRLFVTTDLIGLLATGLMLGSMQSIAASSTSPTSQEHPQFSRAAELLASKQTLAANFEIVTTYAVPYRDTKEVGQIALARPNLLRIDIERHRRVKEGEPWEPAGNGSIAVTDGKQAWKVTTHPKSAQYETQLASESWLNAALVSVSPLASFFTNTAIAPATEVATNRIVEGEAFTVVTAKAQNEGQAYYFDADGFLRRIVTERPATNQGKGARAGFTRREVRISKIAALSQSDLSEQFAYTPPADAVKVVRSRSLQSESEGPRTVRVGDVAPDIVAEDVNGKPIRLSDFAGKPVLVKFWATWCWPCRQSMPETEALSKEHGNDVTILAVVLWDSRKAFRDFVTKYAADRKTTPDKLPIRFAFDPRPMGEDAGSALYNIQATPTHVAIDRDGKIASVDAGYQGPSNKLAQMVAGIR